MQGMNGIAGRNWKDFLRKKKRIFIYGAGIYGGFCAELLEWLGIRVEGFLVSPLQHPATYLGCPVMTASSVSLQIGDGVIAAFLNASFEQLEVPGLREEDCWIPSGTWLYRRYLRVRWFPRLKALGRLPLRMGVISEKPCFENILVARLDLIGDFLLTVPFLRELRRNYPSAHIALVVYENIVDLAKGCPYVDEIAGYPMEKERIGYEHCWGLEFDTAAAREVLQTQLMQTHWDALFLPRQIACGVYSRKELVLAAVSEIPIRFARMDETNDELHLYFCRHVQTQFSNMVVERKPKHETQYMLDILRACHCKVIDERMEYWLSQEHRSYAQWILCRQPEWSYVACGIVGSVAVRSWSPEKYRALFQTFSGRKVMFLLLGGKDAAKAAEAIGNGENILDLTARTTLPQVAAIIDAVDLYVGSDTGLMHFASATGTPVVELSVWLSDGDLRDVSAPHRIGPWQVPSKILLPPAGLDGCKGRCAKSYAHCINAIQVEAVKEAIDELLAGGENENARC